MSQHNRWADKEEAENYIEEAIRNKNCGLKYASACDYLGIGAAEHKGRREATQNALTEDIGFALCSSEELIKIKEMMKAEILDEQFLGTEFKGNEKVLSLEQEIKLIEGTLKERENMNKKYLCIKDTVIKAGTCCNNQDVEYIDLPNAIKIETGAFKNCSNLKEVIFGSNIKSLTIASKAFVGCSSLEDIDLMTLKDINYDFSEEAFGNANHMVTFNTPIRKNVFLEEFAKRHNFIVKKHL